MESLPQTVQQPLEFLIYISMILLVITSVFFVKLLIDLTSLVNCMQNFINIIEVELTPTIREIQSTLGNINNISSNVSDQISTLNDGLKKGVNSFSNSASNACHNAQIIGTSIKDGILSGLKVLVQSKK